MKKSKSRLLTAILFLLAAGFVFLSVYLVRCFHTFGMEVFSKNVYTATAACGDLYKNYLAENMKVLPENLMIKVSADQKNVTIINQASNDSSFFFRYDFSYGDNKHIQYNNTPDFDRYLSTQLAYYGYSSNGTIQTNMESLYLYAYHDLPSYQFYNGQGTASHFLYTYLSPNYMDRHSPYLIQRFLFDSFRVIGIPAVFAFPILLILLVILIQILTKQKPDSSSGQNRRFFHFPCFFFWDFDLCCFLMTACLAFILPILGISRISFWMISLLSTGFALFFLLRFLREIRHRDPQGEDTSHLFFHQIFRQKSDLLLFLLLLILFVIPVGIAGYLPVSFRFIAYLAEGFLLLLFLSRFYSLLSLKSRIQNLADNTMETDYPPLPWPFASVETNLEQIQSDFMKAADERLKGERLKAELITNFSHDLKTPLTSILNYIQLLKKSLPSDPAYDDYLRILETKSVQLKDLTENLLDLSRFSSGNETPHLERCDFSEIVRQANGEFAEQMEEKHLLLKSQLPSDPTYVMIDGANMWRIMENLYGNVIKYALEGTRVYVNLKEDGEHAVFSIRNISKEELNLSPDELTERFVRGDVSRHTDGNGLGLSTVQSLANLLGGQFHLDIQGDLFTASVTLPLADEETD